ncbi:hypothetical protein ACJMK2_021998 [Sinanodonta woodiana]|uniref:Uncharacterized protein n=2 Tax=Sinanodonta woodiana TaxID=1069815 RepID=A0ABD3TJ03_SINWO
MVSDLFDMEIRRTLVLHFVLMLSLDGQSLDNLADNFLVFVDSNNVSVYRMEISSYTFANMSLQSISNPIAIDYDPNNGVIIWTDVGLHRIFSASLTGNNQTTIRTLSTLSVTDGLAVDAVSRLLFYTDTGNDIIAVLSFDGSVQKTIINNSLYEPRAIVADPITGTIFWTDWGNMSKIEKANYDGSNRQQLITTGLVWPNGLAADIQAGVIFWCDAGTEKIERANVDGSQRQVIYQAQQPAHFFGITLYQYYLYYTDWEQRSVMRIRTNGSEQSSVGPSVFGRLNGIRAYKNGTGIQGINGCSNGSGGCSHLCFPQPGGSKQCACPDGMTLQADGQTCKTNNPPDNFLLITELRNRIIYRMDMNTYSFATIPVRNIMNPVAIDYDPTEGLIYWTDVGLRQIFSASIYGHSQKTLLSLNSVAVPDGLAVDAISRLLFYTDTGNDIIAVLSFDGSIRKTVINSSLDEPRAIVVDQFNGYC